MSRQVYLLGVGSTLVALAFLLTEVLLWRPGVTPANVRRVREGMSFQEVKALLGGRPVSLMYPTPAVMFSWEAARAHGFEPEAEPRPAEGSWQWQADEDGATAIVRFDRQVRVRGRVDYQRPDPEFWAALRTWCGQSAPPPGLRARLRSYLGW
jgi:hypothetical protein